MGDTGQLEHITAGEQLEHLSREALMEKFGTVPNYLVLTLMFVFSGLIGGYFWRLGQHSPEVRQLHTA